MVTIPLRSSITSLLITITSLVLELACLFALLVFNAFCECRSLRKGHEVSVARHRLRTQLLTILATLTFVALEVVTSANSRVDFVSDSSTAPCIRSVVRRGFDNDTSFFDDKEVMKGRDVIGLFCADLQKGAIFVRTGNYSLDTLKVQCDTKPLYSYVGAEFLELPPSPPGAKLECGFAEGFGVSICVSVLLQNKTTFLYSEPFADKNPISDQPVRFYPTRLFFSPSEDRLESTSIQLHALYNEGISDDAELRHLVLTDSQRTQCPFDKDTREVTQIKMWAFVLSIVIWGICTVFFTVMLFVRRGVFYDMSNALDWAEKTVHRQPEDDTDTRGGPLSVFVKLEENGDSKTRVTLVRRQSRNEDMNAPENSRFPV